MDGMDKDPESTAAEQPSGAAAGSSDRRAILLALRDLVGAFLKAPPEEDALDVPLLELGANSLTHMEISRAIERRWRITIPNRLFLTDLSSIAAIAEHVSDMLAERAAAPAPLSLPDAPGTVVPSGADPVDPLSQSTGAPPNLGEADLNQVFSAQMKMVEDTLAAVVDRQLAWLRGEASPQDLAAALPVMPGLTGAVPDALPGAVPTASPSTPKTLAAHPPAAKPTSAAKKKSVLPPWKVAELRARGLSEAQAAHLDAFTRRHLARTGGSRRMVQDSRKALADNRASAGFRYSLKEILYPIIGVRGEGAHLWDIDGNRYVDATCGFGVSLFGHQPDFIQTALHAQLDRGIQIGPQAELAGEAAKLFTQLTGTDRVAFCNTGSEAVMAALRLVRTVTGRSKVAIFSGSYHGQADLVLGTAPAHPGAPAEPMAPGITPGMVSDLLVLDYGDPAALETIKAQGDQLAAVLIEPVQSRRPDFRPVEFLKELRRLTEASGTALIFDEMITGFRMHPQGAQGLFGIKADLATYGKVFGGGMPIGAVAGSARFMDAFDGGFWRYGDDSAPTAETTFFAGTFNKHPLAMAAAHAVLTHLTEQGPALQEQLFAKGTALVERLNALFQREQAPIEAVGCGSQFRLAFQGNLELLFHHMLEEGVYVWEGRNCFISTAHDEADLDQIVAAAETSLEQLRGGGFLEDRPTSARRLPLSEAQTQLALQADLAPQAEPAYGVGACLDLTGAVDPDALAAGLATLVARHDALRAGLCADRQTQRIAPASHIALPLRVVDLRSETDPAQKTIKADAEEAAEAATAFDLAAPPLARALLIRFSETESRLVLTLHHIISDGWSLSVLIDELGSLYAAAASGERDLPRWADRHLPPVVSFARFLSHGAAVRRSEDFTGLEGWWKDRLSAPPPVPDMPGDRVRPTGAVRDPAGKRNTALLEAALVTKLEAFGAARGSTLFHVLLTGWLALLHRLTGQDDLIVGVPTAGRGPDWAERVVGYCTHLLPVRSQMDDPAVSVDAFLRLTRDGLLDAQSHEDLPFAVMLERFKPKRDGDKPPLLGTIFNIDRPLGAPDFPGLEAGFVPRPVAAVAYDLAMNLLVLPEGIVAECDHALEVISPEAAQALLAWYRHLLEAMVETPDAPFSTLSLDQGGAVLSGPAPRAAVSSVWDLITEACARDPKALAILETVGTGTGETLDYGTLRDRAEALAASLQAFERGARIGVHLPRGADHILALLACWRLGAVAVPLDPALPEARRVWLAENSRCALVIGEDLPGLDVPIVSVRPDSPPEALVHVPALGPEDGAYMVYTSGSSGAPKGVLVPHRGLPILGHAQAERLDLRAGDRLLQMAAIGFDVTMGDLVTAFAAGAALVLAPKDALLPGPGLEALIAETGVTHAQMPASVVAALPLRAAMPSLRLLVTGGEALAPRSAARVLEKGIRLINAYGPTETTVCCAMAEITPDLVDSGARLPIGTPLDGAKLAVVDAAGRSCPPGVPGELWIGGQGVSLGYPERPELTADRFGPGPDGLGGRWYRSGDIMRQRADGALEFLGRHDAQVKVRGIRVELGEVEASLAALPGVERAVADLRGDGPGGPVLMAWVVEEAGAVISASALRAELRRTLPEVLVPTRIAVLDSLPLTPNGKIDRRALETPEAEGLEADSATTIAPRDQVERTLAGIWRDVLGLGPDAPLDVHANFFDLGGTSLLIPRLKEKLDGALGREIPITDLFRDSSIAAQASRWGAAPVDASLPAPAAPSKTQPSGPIAVIAMTGRFPGAADVDALWQSLLAGEEGIRRLSHAEMLAAGVPQSLIADPNYVPARGVLDGIEYFDAGLFGISPKEAAETDPQHRLLLELAWHALEEAGHDPTREPGRIGVFAGVGANAYAVSNLLPHYPSGGADPAMFRLFIGNDKDFAPTRIAYKLDLRGPAMAVNTACSTSLVAIVEAMKSIRAGECEMALAGGASIPVPQAMGYLREEGSIDSPDGHCRPFDAAAAGTVAGAGAAMVLLRPLEDALADGDPIRAVLLGGALNNDGARKAGYTAPGVEGQSTVIAQALDDAAVPAASISYVEAHGTATPLGDPVEVSALNRVYGDPAREPAPAGSRLIGSLKSNLGHLDAAAGAAGLIKAALSVEAGEVPASLHLQTPNPLVAFQDGPFLPAAERTPWPASENAPRRAAVSSFGIGGTNAHVVLEQPPEQSPGATDARPQTLVLSAVDPASLDIVTERMAERLSGGSFGDQDLADIAWTLQAGRRALPHRLAVSAGSLEEAVTKLRKSSGRGLYRGRVTGAPGAVAFLLPGQGSQRPGMSRDLAAFDAGFAEDLAWASKLLAPRLGRDLSVLLLADPDDQAAAERLRDTALAQPALFAHHYAAARFWMRLGVRPAALLGHSIGELTAACLAGVMRPEDGLMLAAERGRLMAAAKPGVMLAVPLSEADTTALMGSALDLCAVNGPQRCVVGGPESAIADLEKTLAQRGTPGRRLVTSHAFHSRSMDPVLEDFRKAVAAMSLTPPSLPVLSNRTGKPLSAAEATDPSYWVDHLRHAVRFADGLAGLEGAVGAAPLLFDLGPGPGLTALAKGSEVLSGAAPAEALAGLWARGQEIEWRAVKGEHHRRRLRLPLTPFRRQKHWIDPPSRDARTAAGAVAVAAQPSEGTLAPKQRLAQPVWRRLAVVGRKAVAPTQSLRILSGQSKTAKAIAKALAALVPQQEDGAALLVDLRPMDLAEGVAKTRPAWDPEAQSMAFDGPAALMAAADPSPVVVVLPDDPAAAALALGPVLARPFEQAGSKAAALSLSAKDRKDPALVARAICTLLQDDAPIGALRLSGGWLEAAALETLPLPDADSVAEALRARVAGRPILVTGGHGGIGAPLARWLAEAGASGLVLAGRTPLPPRAQWQAHLDQAPEAGPETDPVAARIRSCLELEALGCKTAPIAVDVADPKAFAAALAEAEQNLGLGPVCDVIHSAGLVGADVFQTLDDPALSPSLTAQLAAKGKALDVLSTLFRDRPAGLRLLFSSVAARFGGTGLAAYGAANAHVDAFARLRAEEGWCAIAWDAWSLAGERWQSGTLTEADGLAALGHLLALPDQAQLVVLARPAEGRTAKRADIQAEQAVGSEADAPGAEALSTGPALENDAQRKVAAVFAEVLGVSDPGQDADFLQLGGDSLIAVQAVSRLKLAFGPGVRIDMLFEAPRLADLASMLDGLDGLEGAPSETPSDEDLEEGEL